MLQSVERVRVALLALAVAVIAVVAGPAAESSAHAELISSTPADGASLASVPVAVRLTFTDPIAAEFTRAAVTTPAGTGTVQAGAKGPTVTVPIAGRGPGAYRVVYRVVSADGHPVSGELRFTVTGTPTASTSPGSSTGAQLPTTPPTTPIAAANPANPAGTGSDGGFPWVVVAAIAGAVAAGGGAILAAMRGRRS